MISNQPITVVTGSGRSGTTLMMKMLIAAGMEGYYEKGNNNEELFECMEDTILPRHSVWLEKCFGKCVKIHNWFWKQPPDHYSYRVIWMHRDPEQIAKSTVKLLNREQELKGDEAKYEFNKFIEEGIRSLQNKTPANFSLYPFLTYIKVNYEDLILAPEEQIHKIIKFMDFDESVYSKMRGCIVDRTPANYDGFLENYLK